MCRPIVPSLACLGVRNAYSRWTKFACYWQRVGDPLGCRGDARTFVDHPFHEQGRIVSRCEMKRAGRSRIGQGRPTAEIGRAVFGEGSCEGTTDPVATRLAACGSGLFLAVGTVRALLAQDVRPETDAHRQSDPVVLAATSVTQWKSSDGDWVRLTGSASVLQGVDGVRAREAIVRITDISTENEKILRVDVYAEGQIRVSGTGNTDQPSYRGQFRTNEVQLNCYDRAGPRTEKEPPWGLAIIRRSGLVAPKPALGANARARGASAPCKFLVRPPPQGYCRQRQTFQLLR